MRALAIGAHPDDVEIFCLGLLLRLRDAGHSVEWAVATDGLAGLPAGCDRDTRRREALEAGKHFGIVPRLMGFEDGALTHSVETAAAFRAMVREVSPDLIITHAPYDYHADHRVLSRIVEDVVPPGVALLHCDTMLGVGFLPGLLVDVTSVYEEKLAILSCHRTQQIEKSVEHLRVWSRFRAMQGGRPGVMMAEAYREVPGAGRASASRLLDGLLI